MLKKYGDLIAGIVTILFAGALYVASLFIRQFVFSGVGADFMPKLVAGALAVMGVLLTARAVNDMRIRAAVRRAQAGEAPAQEAPAFRQSYLSVLATAALLLLYALLIDQAGFLIVTVVYLFAQMLVLTPSDKIRPARFALISVAATAFIYAVFTYAFKIRLPGGILG